MKNLICKVGLLCVVLLVIIDTVFAQSFSVRRVGDGKQTIILIPGFACSDEVWEQAVYAFVDGHQSGCYFVVHRLYAAGFILRKTASSLL